MKRLGKFEGSSFQGRVRALKSLLASNNLVPKGLKEVLWRHYQEVGT